LGLNGNFPDIQLTSSFFQITSLQPGSSAAEKLAIGDRIMAVNAHEVTTQVVIFIKYCGLFLRTFFAETFCGHFFADTYCGLFLRIFFADNFCGHFLRTFFADYFLHKKLFIFFQHSAVTYIRSSGNSVTLQISRPAKLSTTTTSSNN